MGAELASRVWGTVGGVYIGVAIKWRLPLEVARPADWDFQGPGSGHCS
jgi:drug/metabolite transporter superfamily protein YnfA